MISLREAKVLETLIEQFPYAGLATVNSDGFADIDSVLIVYDEDREVIYWSGDITQQFAQNIEHNPNASMCVFDSAVQETRKIIIKLSVTPIIDNIVQEKAQTLLQTDVEIPAQDTVNLSEPEQLKPQLFEAQIKSLQIFQ